MVLKTFEYKKFKIEVVVYDDGAFQCCVDPASLSSSSTVTLDEAIKETKDKIDSFIDKSYTNWDEVAQAVWDNLI
jgi:hypothetical protein